MKTFILVLSGLALLFFACDTTKKKTTDTPPVTDSDAWSPQLHDIWVLNELNGSELDKAISRPRLELFPGENKINGHGSCNQIFGNMEATSKTINFSKIGSTKKFCAETMATESEFLKTLGMVDRYLIKGLGLYLFIGDDLVMEFQKVD